jgi:hypothetical protein
MRMFAPTEVRQIARARRLNALLVLVHYNIPIPDIARMDFLTKQKSKYICPMTIIHNIFHPIICHISSTRSE